MVEPVRLFPEMVTGTEAPCAPLLGEIPLRVGPAGFTVKVTPLLVPLELVTVTVCGPVGAVAEMLKVAEMELALTVTPLKVIPVRVLMVDAVRLFPEMVTGTEAPCAPLFGEIPLSVGPAGFTVKVTPLLVPLELVTVTVCGPVGAVAEITNVAEMELAVTVTPLKVIPVRALIVDPVRLFPEMVTGTEVPCAPLFGEIPLNVGPAGFTVKVTPLLVPLELVTVTVCGPVGAVAEMLNVAEMELAITVTPLKVIPVRALMVDPVRLFPEMVTGTEAACAPLFGEIPLSVGPAGFTVKVTPLLVPLELVTVTVCGPVGAVAEMLNVAEMEFAVTVTPLKVIPVRALMVDPVRLFPEMVTGIEAPCAPLFGEIPLSDGPAGFTVKVTRLLVPLEFVTVTVCGPLGAVAEITNVAEMELALTVTPLKVIPVRALIVEPVRLFPDMVTGTEAPCAPLFGEIVLSVGAAEPALRIEMALTMGVPVTAANWTTIWPVVTSNGNDSDNAVYLPTVWYMSKFVNTAKPFIDTLNTRFPAKLTTDSAKSRVTV
jgi:hypothetical protein